MKAKPFDLEVFLVKGERRTDHHQIQKWTMISQADPWDEVFYIEQGSCKVTVVSAEGKEAVVAFHRKGDFSARAV